MRQYTDIPPYKQAAGIDLFRDWRKLSPDQHLRTLKLQSNESTMTTGSNGQVFEVDFNGQCPTTTTFTTSEDGLKRLVTMGHLVAVMARHETQVDSQIAQLRAELTAVRKSKEGR